ncbi:MAG: hypothetical protein ACSHW0_14185 [Thalassotalea sp.]
MFEIRRFDVQCDRDLWDSGIKKCKNANFLHYYDYFTYHIGRFDDHSLLIFKKNKLVALLPANVDGEVVISHSGLTYAGLLRVAELSSLDVGVIFDNIATYYSGLGFKSLLYKAVPYVFSTYPAQEDLYFLFKNKATLVRRDIASVIKFVGEKPKNSKLRDRMVKKAKKCELKVSESNDFNSFHNLLSDVLKKFDTKPVHSVDELNLLKTNFQDEIKLYIACNGTEVLAATLLYDFGHIVHTQYLACSDHGRSVGALDFLLDSLISKYSETKDYFSFGICTENDGYYLNEGLITQKDGFGGRGITHDFYRLDF